MNTTEIAIPECTHETIGVKRTLGNGVEAYGTQCQKCGKWEAVKKSSVSHPDLLGDYSEEIRKRHSDEQRALWHARFEAQLQEVDQKRAAESAEWWRQYNAYLRTAQWRAKSIAVIARDGGMCLGCGNRRAMQAHHLTYAHLFHEPLFDLVAVCRECHDEITALDRARRK
jgi:5-methylcytosine-specific restriction endonuclease McrA